MKVTMEAAIILLMSVIRKSPKRDKTDGEIGLDEKSRLGQLWGLVRMGWSGEVGVVGLLL